MDESIRYCLGLSLAWPTGVSAPLPDKEDFEQALRGMLEMGRDEDV